MERTSTLCQTMWNQHLMFGILKSKIVECLQFSIISWEDLIHFFQSFQLEIVSWMQPVHFNRDFWRRHYNSAILQKEQLEKGSGINYMEKILSRLADSYGIPVIFRIMNEKLADPQVLRQTKIRIRSELLRLMGLPDTYKSALLHISDDSTNANFELQNLREYLNERPDASIPPGFTPSSQSTDVMFSPCSSASSCSSSNSSTNMSAVFSPRMTPKSWDEVIHIPPDTFDQF